METTNIPEILKPLIFHKTCLGEIYVYSMLLLVLNEKINTFNDYIKPYNTGSIIDVSLIGRTLSLFFFHFDEYLYGEFCPF